MHLQPLKSPIHLFSCSCKTTRAAAAAHTFLRGLRYKRGRACLCSLWEESDKRIHCGHNIQGTRTMRVCDVPFLFFPLLPRLMRAE
jgi:hypothetical protein